MLIKSKRDVNFKIVCWSELKQMFTMNMVLKFNFHDEVFRPVVVFLKL